MTMHFEDLKKDQGFVTAKVMEITKGYRAIVIRKAKWEARKQNLATEAAKQGLMLSDIWSYSEEDTGEEMAIDVAQMEFCQERQEAFRLVKAWTQDCANQIATYPGFDVERRRKGAIDFINLMKKYLRTTKPLGCDQEEEEEDEEWLQNKLKKLPEAKLDVGPVKDRLRSSRVKERSRVDSPSTISKEFRTSTPEVARGEKSGKKDDDLAPRSNLGTMMEDKGESISDRIRTMRAQEANAKEDRRREEEEEEEEDDQDECCVVTRRFNPNHSCVKLPEKVAEKEKGDDKEEEEEEDGPDYIVVKKEDAKQKKRRRKASLTMNHSIAA